ncbi:FkbM family methyltransferase [Sinorhizobium medicae]|nr:FkbM family methyltransferase [Sinorhizobium medicae]MDX0881571.1 FkbM family methyltransferase [Sinorhizobium medicae]
MARAPRQVVSWLGYMTTRIIRSLRKRFRRAFKPRTVSIFGVKLIAADERVPPYLQDLMYREVYEDTERNILLKILKPSARVLEIGTGVGFIAALAAAICGQDNVSTYEANSSLASLIRDNSRLNQLEPHLVLKAVTSDGRTVSFHQAENVISSSIFDRKIVGHTIEVESVKFSHILDRHRPDVLIMDVEGAEDELLRIPGFGSVQHIPVELQPHIIGRDKVDELKRIVELRGFRQRFSDHLSARRIRTINALRAAPPLAMDAGLKILAPDAVFATMAQACQGVRDQLRRHENLHPRWNSDRSLARVLARIGHCRHPMPGRQLGSRQVHLHSYGSHVVTTRALARFTRA